MRRREAGGERAHVALSLGEQHADNVRRLIRQVDFRPIQAAGHPEQLIDRDRRARIVGAAPFRDIGGRMDVELAVHHQKSGERLGDALGHRPGSTGHVRTETLPIPFEDEFAAPDQDESLMLAQLFARLRFKAFLDNRAHRMIGRKVGDRPSVRRPRNLRRLRGEGRQRRRLHQRFLVEVFVELRAGLVAQHGKVTIQRVVAADHRGPRGVAEILGLRLGHRKAEEMHR